MLSVRRDIHQNPELGFQEVRTSAKIREQLEKAGFVVRSCAGTGLLADLQFERGGPAILIRADMDALNLKEETGLPFASTNGKHHACGHDGHVAMLLATAIQLKKLKPRLRGSVRFAFQPAEEGLGGARVMVQQGAV
jgi:amidohydrolase